ncbi:hypothetical protein CLV31_11286 [Algoriphagus aquaeductus]|uniref:Uncharacterized protein n=1 Tax=Algoriphagus aquaeductus TaxID=475299 RepID=A0A326RXX2_9BACT|nr:hypothetical protein CLV31_11286 [Algoriphagus aquaeductus]
MISMNQSGCRKFCDNHFLHQFSFIKNIVDVFADSFDISSKEGGNLISI